MFDIGFFEIIAIAVIALLVIGPEKFPEVLYSAGKAFSKARGYINTLQEGLEKEVKKAEQLKEAVVDELKIAEMHEQLDNTMRQVPILKKDALKKYLTEESSPEKPALEPTTTAEQEVPAETQAKTQNSTEAKANTTPTA